MYISSSGCFVLDVAAYVVTAPAITAAELQLTRADQLLDDTHLAVAILA